MMGSTYNRLKIDVGYRTGSLTVLGCTQERKNGYMAWRCACDYGGEILLDTQMLQRGAMTDCVCGGCRGFAGTSEVSASGSSYASKRHSSVAGTVL